MARTESKFKTLAQPYITQFLIYQTVKLFCPKNFYPAISKLKEYMEFYASVFFSEAKTEY